MMHAIKDHIIANKIMGGYVVGLCLGTVLAPICIRVIKTKMDAVDEQHQRPTNNNSDCPIDNQQPRRQEEPNDDYVANNRNNASVPVPNKEGLKKEEEEKQKKKKAPLNTNYQIINSKMT